MATAVIFTVEDSHRIRGGSVLVIPTAVISTAGTESRVIPTAVIFTAGTPTAVILTAVAWSVAKATAVILTAGPGPWWLAPR